MLSCFRSYQFAFTESLAWRLSIHSLLLLINNKNNLSPMFTYNDDSWKSSASIYSPENNELEESSYWLSGTSQRRNGDHLLTQNVFLQAHFGFENCLKLIILILNYFSRGSFSPYHTKKKPLCTIFKTKYKVLLVYSSDVELLVPDWVLYTSVPKLDAIPSGVGPIIERLE